MDDGSGGTKVLFDSDGTGGNPQWPDYIINLDGVRVTSWSQLTGGGATTPPPTTSAPTISIGTTSQLKAEGNTRTTIFSILVNRSGDTSGSSTVSWATAGSGANPANGAD